MATAANLSATKMILATPVLLAFLAFVVPSFWPPPAVKTMTEPTVAAGEDMKFTLRVRTWHENYHLRLVRVTINDVSSPAYLGRSPLLPLTLIREDMIQKWDLGLLNRVTFPRTLSLDLLAPFGQLYRRGDIGTGILRGTISVEIDYTRAQFNGEYPSLVFSTDLPFEVTIAR